MRRSFFKTFIAKVVFNTRVVLLGPLSTFRKNNVCMWHAGRCGSTVIADLMRQDGRIDWGGEVLDVFLEKMMEENAPRHIKLDRIFRRINKRQKSSGHKDFGYEMKLWHYELLNLYLDDMLKINKKLNINKNVILERKNSLKIVVSSKLAKSSGVWHLTGEQKIKSNKTIMDLSDNNLLNVLGLHKKFYDDLKEKLSNNYIYLCYEDDIESNPRKGYSKICDYLGMEPKSIVTTLKRTNPGKLIDKIENYSEVQNHLKGTPYHWMINA